MSDDVRADASVGPVNVPHVDDRLGPEHFLHLRGVEWVAAAAEWALREKGATANSPMTASEIFEVVDLFDPPISAGTFSTYLSPISKQLESPITSMGRGRSGGYFLSERTETLAEEAEDTSATDDVQDWGKEKYLYPSLVAWLSGEGYQAKDTSAVRNKQLGKWGNPDVTGFVVEEHLSQVEIASVTIEAKLGVSSWETDFFQAVSQRRCANRAYFAFALPEESSNKFPRDLRYYSERFSVGVLVIIINDEIYDRLNSGTLTEQDRTELLRSDGSNVSEVLSAPSTVVPLLYQRRLCQAVGIDSLQQLMRWGSANES